MLLQTRPETAADAWGAWGPSDESEAEEEEEEEAGEEDVEDERSPVSSDRDQSSRRGKKSGMRKGQAEKGRFEDQASSEEEDEDDSARNDSDVEMLDGLGGHPIPIPKPGGPSKLAAGDAGATSSAPGSATKLGSVLFGTLSAGEAEKAKAAARKKSAQARAAARRKEKDDYSRNEFIDLHGDKEYNKTPEGWSLATDPATRFRHRSGHHVQYRCHLLFRCHFLLRYAYAAHTVCHFLPCSGASVEGVRSCRERAQSPAREGPKSCP